MSVTGCLHDEKLAKTGMWLKQIGVCPVGRTHQSGNVKQNTVRGVNEQDPQAETNTDDHDDIVRLKLRASSIDEMRRITERCGLCNVCEHVVLSVCR